MTKREIKHLTIIILCLLFLFLFFEIKPQEIDHSDITLQYQFHSEMLTEDDYSDLKLLDIFPVNNIDNYL